MILFDFNKEQDRYYLKNTGTESFNFSLKRLSDCTNFIEVYNQEVLVGSTVEIPLSQDGEYELELTDSNNPSVTLNLRYYLGLLNNIIENLEEAICSCDCGCDCEDNFCHLLMTRAKMDTYKRLINPEAVSFFDAVYKETKCLISKQVNCSVTEDTILGESKCNEKLIKQLLALDYLALYFYEYAQGSGATFTQFIRTKFNTEKLFCCVKDLHISVEKIQNLIDNNMGTFTINSATYINQAPTCGNNNISVANRANTILTLAMFTTDTLPAYSDPENDPVADLRINTLPEDGTLILSGTPVTAGQIIPVAEINAGNLSYQSPNQDASDVDDFDFSLRDTGSGQFSS